jgi:hypothetical protein
MLDDTFLLHEEVFPDYLKLVPEGVVITLLIIAVLAFLYFNWDEILRGEYALMFLALGLFGLSVFIDALPEDWYENTYLLNKLEHIFEDGAKLAAIVTWVAFYGRYAYTQFMDQICPPGKQISRQYNQPSLFQEKQIGGNPNVN